MFICAEMYRTIEVDELTVIKQDKTSGGIGVYIITGEKVGAVVGRQPSGCVDFWTVADAAADNRILARAAIVCGRVLILSSDSKALEAAPREYVREEIEGYGMMVGRPSVNVR